MNSKKAVGVQDEDTKLKKKYSTKIKIRAYIVQQICVWVESETEKKDQRIRRIPR